MKISEEQKEHIINCGVFGYDPEMMSIVLEISQNEIEAELSNPDSEFSQLIKIGRDRAEYVIDMKLFQMAKSGDLRALEKFEMRKNKRKIEEERRKKKRN